MAEAKVEQFPHPKIILIILIILLPLSLWALLLWIAPYSASLDLLLKILIWGIPAYLFPKFVEKNHPNKFLQLNKPPSAKWILLSVAFLAAYFTLINANRLGVKPVSLFYVVSAVLISPVIEEIAFRGVILQMLHRYMRWAYANVATAVLFMLYHIPLWMARGQSISLMGCLWVIFFALLMGFVLLRSKSLWTCIIIHAAQNLILGIL
jgi:uncharacterized protein